MAGSINPDFSLSYVGNVVGQATASREAMLKATLSSLGDNPSTGESLKLQAQMQEWSIFAQTQTTVLKVVADVIKDVIAKSA